MKRQIHAIAGVAGFLCIVIFVASTIYSELFGAQGEKDAAKGLIFKGMFLLLPALLIAGASGMSLLGKRSETLALAKQKRGPIAFMTGLFVLLPCSYFLSSWASQGVYDGWFYGVQALELAASALVFVMIGLNIRGGLALTGRIAGHNVKSPVIEEREGGPFVAMSIPMLTNSDGKVLAKKPVAALCRCGASKNKPYCDGSHSTIGFNSNPSDERAKDKVLAYEGKEGTVHYNRLLCSHAAECGKRQKSAFDSSRKPWIIPDNARKQDILAVVQACPSGALRYSLPGETPEQILQEIAGITVEKNGPYRVAGIPLASARLAEGASAEKYVLCRCGASKNKPYCDGSHLDNSWKDTNV